MSTGRPLGSTGQFDRSTAWSGFPRHGIGRGFKVAREEIVALLVALRCFAAVDYRGDSCRYHGYLQTVADGLADLPGIGTLLDGTSDDRFPRLNVRLDEARLGLTAFEATHALRHGQPAVYVNEGSLHRGALVLHPVGLDARFIPVLVQRIPPLEQ